MRQIELVVTDLDGTLWDARERIHDRTFRALVELDRRNVPLLVATGRRLRSARNGLVRSGLLPPAVALDGALGRDLVSERTFHKTWFRSDEAIRVLEAFQRCGLEPCLCVDRDGEAALSETIADVLVGAAPSTNPRHLAAIGAGLGRANLADAVRQEQIFAFCVVGSFGPLLDGVVEGIDGSGHATITQDTLFGGDTLVVSPPGISKWEGVLAYCADQGLDPQAVLAVGDGRNDLELLAGARVACAVGNACTEARAVADHILDPVTEGGWAGVLDWL